ncbi:NAD-dependent epimerase/dehydratase family protein [Patescibacteria group bacterium AH-259-L07]|nr:NAD-dependent epimerase/dehydratase family protein [Patescibacteria group bacterium AH-259-L07]
MKILVTGGTGFIGAHLVNVLSKKGHQVIVISRTKKPHKQNIKFYKIDICSPKLNLIFEYEKPDVVFHVAALLSAKNNVTIMKTNVMGSLNILECSQKYKAKKFIFASSAAVYGHTRTDTVGENHSTNPLSVYGLSKLTTEKLIKIYYNEYNIPYIILRYSNIYGPKQKPFRPGSVVANFIYKIVHNEIPEINGTGKQLRDYIYIDDLIRAHLLALKTKKIGVYNLGSGVGTSLNDIISKININLNKNIKPKYKLSTKRGVEKSILDITKIKKDMNWRPKTNINIGLQKTINYFKCL